MNSIKYLIAGISMASLTAIVCAQDKMYNGEVADNHGGSFESEYGKAFLSSNGNELFFVKSFDFSIKRGYVSQGIWMADWKTDKKLSNAKLVGNINNYYNNGVVGFSKDGERVYLLGTYSNKERLWPGVSMSMRTETGWTKPQPVEVAKLHIRSAMFDFFVTPDETAMFIAMGNSEYGQSDLFISTKDEAGNWLEPVIISTINTDSTHEISPFYSDEFNALYFASDRSGGLGGFDIYSSKKGATWMDWSAPEALPKPVNSDMFDAYFTTYKNEGSFVVSNRSDSLSKLYFLKNFLPEGEMKQPTDAEEMPIEDNFTSVEGTFIYNDLPRSGVEVLLLDENGNLVGKGITDENGLYQFTKLPKDHQYHLLYTDKDGSFDPSLANLEEKGMDDAPIKSVEGLFKYNNLPKEGVTVVLVDEDGNQVQKTLTDASGLYKFENLPSDKFYKVMYLDMEDEMDAKLSNLGEMDTDQIADVASSPNRAYSKTQKPENKPVATTNDKKDVKTVAPSKPASGSSPSTFGNSQHLLYFEFNEVIPSGTNTIKLDGKILPNKDRQLEIIGHTDGIGSDEVNVKVSLQRADQVKKYLVRQGYPTDLIITKGMGKAQPVADNSTEEGRAQNRRVEIRF